MKAARSAALLLLLLLGAATLPASAPEPAVASAPPDTGTWRAVHLSEAGREALDAAIERLTMKILSARFGGIELLDPTYTVETDGEDFRVVLPEIRVRVSKLEGWKSDVEGEIVLHDFVVRYGPLAATKLDLLSSPTATVLIEAPVENLVDYLRDWGVQDPYLRFPEETGDIALGGAIEVPFLFLRFHPHIRMRGLWAREADRHVFHLNDLFVSETPGFVRAAVRTVIERVCRRGLGLDQGLALLEENGAPVVRVELHFFRAGSPIYSQILSSTVSP